VFWTFWPDCPDWRGFEGEHAKTAQVKTNPNTVPTLLYVKVFINIGRIYNRVCQVLLENIFDLNYLLKSIGYIFK
jgi:hypothetical protein